MSSASEQPLERLAHYELEERIGEGALGWVYRARDTKLNRTVALKVLPTEITQKELREFFHMEARAIAALEHPNIVSVLDFADPEAEEQFIALEFLEGASWGDILDNHGPATEQIALCIGHEVATALEYAHDQNVIHRDLKPDNVIIDGERVVLIDFGAMKTEGNDLIPEAETQKRRHTVGTIGFMAPEQVEGAEMDARVDLFSLGAMLYKATTSHHPYWVETRNLRDIKRESRRGNYRDPRDFQPLLTSSFSDLLARLLATSPKKRIANATEVRMLIAELLRAHGIEDPKPILAQYSKTPGFDQQHDLRTVDTLVRELRLALLRDLYNAIQKQSDDDIRWATSRLRYYSSMFDDAEQFFLLEDKSKPRLLKRHRPRRGLFFALGLVLAAGGTIALTLTRPDFFVRVHDLVYALLSGLPKP